MSTNVAEVAPAGERRTTWPVAALILGTACVAQAALWYRYAEDSTYSKMSILFVWPAALFALFVWWTFFSGYRWRTRLGVLGGVTLAWMSFLAIFRIDGSDGDMLPVLSFRWEPTPEDKARAFWRNQPVAATGATTSAIETSDDEAPEDALAPGPNDSVDFRGNGRDGIVRGDGFRKDWDVRPPAELWRHPVGLGWSSFAVLGDFAVTMEQRDDLECVVCYSLSTGDLLWLHGDTARFEQVAVNGGDGPHATPVIAGNRTYALGGTGLLNCLETRTGRQIWQRNILDDAGTEGQPAANLPWGMSGAPYVVDDLVLVIAGGTAGKSVIAYDRHTGQPRWAQGQFPASYTGPRVEEFHGERIVLAFHGEGLSGHNLETGAVLWNFPWKNDPLVNAAQPIKLEDGALFISNGYGVGAARLEVVRPAADGTWSVAPAWTSNRLKLKFNDAVLHEGFVYGLDDGILTCLDTATGKPKWKGGRYGYGQLLLHDDTLLVLTEDGDVALAEANPRQFRERHRMRALSGTTWNHPVVAHGKLLVRNNTEAACFDVAP
jgi:outer membrane protein assembly factor BamB